MHRSRNGYRLHMADEAFAGSNGQASLRWLCSAKSLDKWKQ